MSFSIQFHDVYRHLLTWLLSEACVEQRNARTGHGVRAGRGGTSFRLDLHDRVLPTCGLRKTFPKSAAAETAWYVHGEQDVTWMRRYAPLWDKFTEADGVTVKAAYGYRWRRHFGRDQLALAVEALKRDPSDRRVFISAWDPSEDGLGAVLQKNVPCPTSFNLCVIDGELHSTLNLRSSDVVVGLPYDVMGHAYLMDAIAASLDLRRGPGVMQVVLDHAHMYEDHYDIARECLEQKAVVPQMMLPGLALEHIMADRDIYVQHVASTTQKYDWPAFNPRPFVVE
jgi:thymidylate synthase